MNLVKKAIILAVITGCLVSSSVIFYYKQVDFSKVEECFNEEKNIAYIETEKEKEEPKEKTSWFNWKKDEEKDKEVKNKEENKDEN